jgi:hypothetical protein
MNKAKIFVRERSRIIEKGKKPRFRIVAVLDSNLSIKANHFRKKELEEIALAANAEMIYLQDSQDGSGKCSNEES